MSTIVIKLGGAAGIDPAAAAPEIAELVRAGERVVIVHGASDQTDRLAGALGHPSRTIHSPSGRRSRRTDARTLEIFRMACAGINGAIVESLRAHGVDAVGLSGVDAGVWIGSRKTAIRSIEDGRTVIIRDDLSGRIESVNRGFLDGLLGAGLVPVLGPPGVTAEGVAINVDADRAAAATAATLGAGELLLLSNVRGLLRDPDDPGSVIDTIGDDEIDIARMSALGRMKNKVLAAEEALTGGVGRVVIASARGPDSIARARAGGGTVFGRAVPA